MTVNDFIEKYTNDEQELITIDYVPFQKKLDVCTTIIADTCYENGKLKMNSPLRNILYRMVLIDIYTDIDVDFGNYIEEYDTLRQADDEYDPAIAWIFAVLNEDDIREFDHIMQQCLSDLKFNEGETK